MQRREPTLENIFLRYVRASDSTEAQP